MLQKGNNKSAGFIKMKSLKHLEILQQHNDEESSGDFSSFEYQKELHGDSSQFSPYKHPAPLKFESKFNIEKEQRQERKKDIKNLFSNEKLKKNYKNQERKIKAVASEKHFLLDYNKRKNDEKKEKNYEDKKFFNQQKHEPQRINYEVECSCSSSEKENYKKKREKTENIEQYYEYSDECSEEQEKLKVHEESMVNGENSEDMYVSFKPHFKESEKKKKKKEKEKKNTLHKTKGGICFQLNTNQFCMKPEDQIKYRIERYNQIVKGKKKKKVESKEQILKRRQVARLYDRQARRRIFGS